MDLLPEEEFYAKLNTVNLAAGALIRDETGKVLVVNPTYRDHWLIPGGSVDKDESPRESCAREIREELGLNLVVGRLLGIEYLARRNYKPEAIHFIFDGGVLTLAQISQITLCTSELSEFKFLEIDLACERLNRSLAVRFRAAWEQLNSGTAYLERGKSF
jgi:8-oxo-dGTP pyrophosphatase MutT (NUDIX family)